MAGAMASEVPTMQPIIRAKPARLGRVGKGQRLREAAGLVELDVDGVVEPDEPVEARRGRARSRRRRPEPGARSGARAPSSCRRQGLLDEGEAGVGAGGEMHPRGSSALQPSLASAIRVASGAASRTARDPRESSPSGAAELDLEDRPLAAGARRLGHGLRRVRG